ncbi:unnamed protein product, partial [Mesorhabditis belari]|uniref:Uncharacterized protein n=1 Tax=Mesorhabditis belari TaxID=2138241 RepID=A0AAF3EHL1_9BILA
MSGCKEHKKFLHSSHQMRRKQERFCRGVYGSTPARLPRQIVEALPAQVFPIQSLDGREQIKVDKKQIVTQQNLGPATAVINQKKKSGSY